MIRHRLIAWLIAFALLVPTLALSQSASIIGTSVQPNPGWVPGIRPFLASSLINQPIQGSYAILNTATISGTTLTFASATGIPVAIGQTITDSAVGTTFHVAFGTTITGGSGTTWTVTPSQTVSFSETMYANTYTPFASWPALPANVALYGLNVGVKIYNAAPTDPFVAVTVNNNSWGTIGNPVIQVPIGGTGALGQPDGHVTIINYYNSTITGSISGTVLTATALTGTPILTSQQITTGASAGTTIIGSALTNPTGCSPNCTGSGGAGTYAVSISQTVGSGSLALTGTTEWDFEQFTRTNNTTATATSQAYCDVYTSNGYGTVSPFKGCGTQAIGTATMAGMIAPEEYLQGSIPHKLTFGMRSALCQGPSGSTPGVNFLSPLAVRGDCNGTGIFEGQIMAIPPGTTRPVGLSPVGIIMFNTLITYGAYIADNQSQIAFSASQSTPLAVSSVINSGDAQLLIPLMQKVN